MKITNSLLTCFLLNSLLLSTLPTVCAAFIHILKPSNNSYILASSAPISIRVNSSAPTAQLHLCLRLFSAYFDPIPLGCFQPDQAKDLQLGRIPYGQHQLRVTLADESKLHDSTRVNIHAVPILPTSSIANNEQRCVSSQQKPAKVSAVQGFSLLILVNRGAVSFREAVESWMKSGLLALARERIVFLQEAPRDPLQDIRIAFLKHLPLEFKVIGSPSQIGIGPALVRLLHEASSEVVMFIEEDFHVNEQFITRTDLAVEQEVEASIQLLSSGAVDIIKLRHRGSPGFPFYPYIWRGREREMLSTWTPYISNHSVLETTHWLIDPLIHFPESVLWLCNPSQRSFFCAFSTHAGWSNNPFLVKTSAALDLLEAVVEADWTRTIEGAINLSPHLWDYKCLVVAQGHGIFTHRDNDGRPRQQQSPYEDPFDSVVRMRLAVLEGS